MAVWVLAGCTPTPSPAPSAPSSSGSASPSASIEPSADATPQLYPSGTADQNKPFFQSVLTQVWNGDNRSSSRSYVDALVAGGFDKGAMQVTPETTPNGNVVDAIEVSVLMAGQCLIGQANFAGNSITSTVLPVISGGGCLVGDTLPINW